VDEYLDRVYSRAGSQPIALYVGYYESQRTGDTMHSPKNCLPGGGWEPLRTRRVTVPVSERAQVPVNEYLVAKGLDRQLVIYWYQSRGRAVASEYWGKVWLVADAITRNRTDGALVRVATPVGADEEKARADAMEFVQAFYPQLARFVPN
jgi:EpsI family protein